MMYLCLLKLTFTYRKVWGAVSRENAGALVANAPLTPLQKLQQQRAARRQCAAAGPTTSNDPGSTGNTNNGPPAAEGSAAHSTLALSTAATGTTSA